MNNNKIYKQKSHFWKWAVSFTLIATLMVGAVTALFMNKTDKTENALAVQNEFTAEMANTEYVTLSMRSSAVPMATAVENSVSKTLTATVLPETAVNKAIDWSIDWGDDGKTENVTDYVTVTPTSDGSNVATVTCYKAFTGTIVITATTRENGYSATCVVTFVGMPADIVLNGPISQTNGEYKVGIGQTYTFNVSLTNPLGNVGSQFNSVSCGVNGVGSVVLGYMEHYNASGNDKWYDTSDQTVTLDSLKDNFITVSYSQGVLTIKTIKSIESYYSSSQRMDGGRTTAYHDKFRSFVDDCYFKVWVKEETSGLMKEFNVRFDDGVVTGVSLAENELAF